MSTFLSDLFTNADGTIITSHTTAVPAAGAWTVSPGFVTALGPNAPVIVNNRLRGNHSGGCFLYASQSAGADGESAEIAIRRFTGVGGAGVTVRHQPGQDKCYGALIAASTGTITLWRLDNSVTLVSLGTFATSWANGSDHTIKLTASGTGASVALTVSIDGVDQAPINDTSANRIVTLGRSGLYFDTITTASTGLHVDSITGVDPSVASSMAFTIPVDGKVAPLSSGASGTASIAVAGTYTGTAPDQWRLVLDGTSTPVSGFDWTAFSVAPAANAFAQTIAAVPKGGWYQLQVRASSAPGTVYSSGKVGAGVLVCVDGQSWAWLFFSTTAYAGDSSLAPNARLRITGKQPAGAWVAPATATMNGAIAMGNAMVTALDCPVGLIDGSWDASGLTIAGGSGASGPNGRWISAGAAGNAYTSSAAAVAAAGGAAATVWIQGQGDAGANVSQASYYTAFGQMTALRRATLGSTHPYVVVTHPRYTAGLTDAQVEAIRKAHVQAAADANNYRVDSIDLPLHSDGVHATAAGFTALGLRCAQAVLFALGVVAWYRGPRIGSAVQVSSTVYDLNLTLSAGATDITPSSGITGVRALVSGTPVTISSVVRQAAAKVRVTLAAVPASLPTFDHLFGTAPTITSLVKDNSGLTLPMEYHSGVLATVIPSIATILRDGAGAPLAGLTVRWAWFDSATVDTLATATDKGQVVTGAGGEFTTPLPNSAMSSGATGVLTLSTSAGVAATDSRGAALPYQIGTDPAAVNLLFQLGGNGAGTAGAGFSRLQGGH